MEGKDNIKELFSQKLGNFEAPVNPELWAKISSQVAAAGSATAASTGLSLWAKVAIGIGASTAAIATVVVLSTSSNSEKEIPAGAKTELQESGTKSVESLDTETQSKSGSVQESAEVEANNGINSELEPTHLTSLHSNGELAHGVTNDVDHDFHVNSMGTKSVIGVVNTENEPEIVQGITYLNVTTYGAELEDSEEYTLEQEQPSTKVVPIKRFVDVFTPNGDMQNDEFFLESEGLTDFTIVVFNPEGEIVYTSNDPNFRWDGRDIRTNLIVPPGNYMYMVTAYDSEKNPYPIYERLEIRE